jgi:putative phosphoesterase
MKIAVFSDIHANLHALEAVWRELESQQPDAIYCLGDLVGYGAFPNEVVNFLCENKVDTIMGNYDEGVGFDMEDCGCAYRTEAMRRLGRRSIFWTREHTSHESKLFLQQLPMQIRTEINGREVLMVHGSPRRMNEYLYEDRPKASFERIAKLAGCDLLLFGHTHLPYEKEVRGTHFINMGSVGKPKDGDPRAGYVLLEAGRRTKATFRRVPYDVAAAAKAVRDAGLPGEFAAQLENGG